MYFKYYYKLHYTKCVCRHFYVIYYFDFTCLINYSKLNILYSEIFTSSTKLYFRIVEQHRVNALFTIPTACRVLKRADPSAKYARRYCGNSLKTVFLAGEHCDQDTRVSSPGYWRF